MVIWRMKDIFDLKSSKESFLKGLRHHEIRWCFLTIYVSTVPFSGGESGGGASLTQGDGENLNFMHFMQLLSLLVSGSLASYFALATLA